MRTIMKWFRGWVKHTDIPPSSPTTPPEEKQEIVNRQKMVAAKLRVMRRNG